MMTVSIGLTYIVLMDNFILIVVSVLKYNPKK
jgi:hypothetical protein